MVLLGLFLCFTQVIGYIYNVDCCVREPKIQTLSNLDEKGVTEVTSNQGDQYCPEFL